MKSFFENPKLYRFDEPSDRSFHTNGNVSAELMVVYKSEDIPGNGREFLESILQAIGQSMDRAMTVEVSLVSNFSFYMVRRLMASQDPFQVLVFGLTPDELGFKGGLHLYHLYHFEGFDILFSDDLKHLSDNQRKKKNLWNELKRHFVS